MPSINYSGAISAARAQGKRKGHNDRRIAREARMEARIRELADKKEMRQNEMAKSERDRGLEAAVSEDTQFQKLRKDGFIDETGTYTPAYWRAQAVQKRKDSGVKYSVAELQEWESEIDTHASNAASGKAERFDRQYDMSKIDARYGEKQRYNAAVAEEEGSKRVGFGGLLDRAADLGTTAITGEPKETPQLQDIDTSRVNPAMTYGADTFKAPEAPEAPMELKQVTGINEGLMVDPSTSKPFVPWSNNGEIGRIVEGAWVPVDKAEPYVSAPEGVTFKLEDFHVAEKLDEKGEPIPGRTYRIATDEAGKQAYVLENGKWNKAEGEYQALNKEKTGVGQTKTADFKSPLNDETFTKRSAMEGRAVNSLQALAETVGSKMANPKDFADRLFESLGNTLAAVVGFDGTEEEVVNQYLNATSSEERAIIKERMGYGVEDAIHAGTAKQRELFATLHLARALAGTGKLSVNAMQMARDVTEGGSGTKSLSTLGNAQRSMESTLHRSIISQAGHHNDKLEMMRPSAAKNRAERTKGYPVFSSSEYRTMIQKLGQAPDPAVTSLLDKAFKAQTIFFKDEHGRTMAPSIVRYTTKEGEEAFTIDIRPQHYE